MRKPFFTSLITGAALFFSLNASAHYYLNVINHSKAGMLFKIAEHSARYTTTNGMTHFPEQPSPTTLIFSSKQDSVFVYSFFTIGTADGKRYCQVMAVGDDGYDSRLKANAGFHCYMKRINNNTDDLLIEK